jgi:hypothetical protein
MSLIDDQCEKEAPAKLRPIRVFEKIVCKKTPASLPDYAFAAILFPDIMKNIVKALHGWLMR